MRNWISKKLNIVLIAGGVLVISTAMLITGIYFAGAAEENKIIKTAYAADEVEEVLDASDDNVAEEEAGDTEQPDTAESTDDVVALSESAVETPSPVATGTQVSEPGPENITEEEAISAF